MRRILAPFLLAFSCVASTSPARALEEKTLKAAIARLEEEKTLALDFFTGFSGSECGPSVALLVILSDKDALKTFSQLADRPGAPGLYGLIGLRITDKEGQLYTKKAQEYLAREKGKEVPTIIGCDISDEKVEACLQISPESKNRRILKHGEYAARVFTPSSQLVKADRVIENGILPQVLTIPWFNMAHATAEDLKDPEMAERKREFDEILKQDLLFKNPAGILKLLEMDSDEAVMFQFKNDP